MVRFLYYRCRSLMICTAICLVGCNLTQEQAEVTVPVRDLILAEHREQFGESGPISGMVLGMNWVDGFLLVADHDNSRVLKLDGALNVKAEIGRYGQGPGELQWASYPTSANGRLSVYSGQARMLVHYDANGTYLGQTSLSHRPPSTPIAAFEDIFFVSWPYENSAITAVGLDGTHLFEFGELQFTKNFNEKRARNHKLLAMLQRPDQPVLVAVGETEPIIEVFDVNGTRLLRKNLSGNPFLRKRMEQVAEAYRQDPSNREKAYILFRDVAVVGNSLYVLISTLTPPHQIMRFDIENTEVVFKGVWQIHDDVRIRNLAYDGGEGIFIYDAKSNELGRYKFYQP